MSDLDHTGYLSNVLETLAEGVANDSRYSPERRAHATALFTRFHKEIAVALRLPKAESRKDRHGLRLVVFDRSSHHGV